MDSVLGLGDSAAQGASRLQAGGTQTTAGAAGGSAPTQQDPRGSQGQGVAGSDDRGQQCFVATISGVDDPASCNAVATQAGVLEASQAPAPSVQVESALARTGAYLALATLAGVLLVIAGLGLARFRRPSASAG